MKDRTPYAGEPNFKTIIPSRTKSPKPVYFAPETTFWDSLFGKKQRKIEEAVSTHEQAVSKWQATETAEEDLLNHRLRQWHSDRSEFDADYQAEKSSFLEAQDEQNSKIDDLAAGVGRSDPKSVLEHANMVLDASDYDGLFEKSYDIEYQPAPAKILLIGYELPSPEHMPVVKNVRFVASTGEVKETRISEKEEKNNFDSVCYQICLRTIHELFESDEHDNYSAILFNGFSTSVNKATGKDTRSCIMSLLVKRDEFMAIDLARIDPKSCFKSLKGVSASSLAALAPIAPVLEMNREDRRFIEARTVVGDLDSATNLASMDWGDFEHLVRELFEKEFASRGGEVKVTQSSSDGGVDAVAFDPDPITGGKIVIQAKRYTKTVGVSAVRDLYGTMQHEGASRGILISTADYGPDAHKFASGKPISLFTGSHLLHLLEKHGYNAKIDLAEARKVMNLR